MEGGVGRLHGGIAVVCQELDEWGEEIEYDLLTMGKRLEDLGTLALSWRDLLVIIRQAPLDSAYVRAKRGEAAHWGVAEYLLATVVDALEAANWQRGNQGAKTPSPRPKPVHRPGVKDEKKTFGADAIPVSRFNDWWESN